MSVNFTNNWGCLANFMKRNEVGSMSVPNEIRQAVEAAGLHVYRAVEIAPGYFNVETTEGCRAARIVGDTVEVY